MSGLEALAVPALIGSTALGTGTSILGQQMAGREAQRSAEFEAQQYERQGRAIQTRAAQDEAARRRDLEASLGTIMAIGAGRNLDPDSPGRQAITRGIVENAERDINTGSANYAGQEAAAFSAAGQSRRKGRYSMLAADVGSLTSLASGFGKIGMGGRYGGFSGYGSGGGAAP
jgi:hypothetical protein